MLSRNSYLADVDDKEFESFFGPIDKELYESQHFVSPMEPMFPSNAIKSYVEPLTRRIKSRSKHNLVYSSWLSSVHGPNDTKVINLELAYHKSGAAYGKIVHAQIRLSKNEPFIELFAAKVVRNAPEDQLLLLSSGGDTVASWEKYVFE